MHGRVLVAGLGSALLATAAHAQVPPDIAAQLHQIGPKIDPRVGTIYAPLAPKPPYRGAVVTRDIAYGPDPLQKLDVFAPSAAGAKRPILIFVHGGGFVRGDKTQAGTPFYDNVMAWAADHGLVGVNIDYRLAPAAKWPSGVKDVGAVVGWVRAHAAQYGGDPDKIYLWGHSAGAFHVADYLAHPELQPGGSPGVAGAILMSGAYDPIRQPSPYYGDDPAVVASLASKPGLLKTPVRLMIINAELDPPFMIASGKSLKDALCAEGRCPVYLLAKDHDHLSEGFAIGTPDQSVSQPVLGFVTGIH